MVHPSKRRLRTPRHAFGSPLHVRASLQVSGLYNQMVSLVHHAPEEKKSAFLKEVPQASDEAEAQEVVGPAALFHVAFDWPGYGRFHYIQ